MKRSILASLLVLNAILFCHASGPSHRHSEKMRTVITTDGEVDDMNSFIRMLLYSDKLQIEGLIYSSSMWHYAGDGKGTLFTSEMPMTEKMYGQRSSLRWDRNDLDGRADCEICFSLSNSLEKLYLPRNDRDSAKITRRKPRALHRRGRAGTLIHLL